MIEEAVAAAVIFAAGAGCGALVAFGVIGVVAVLRVPRSNPYRPGDPLATAQGPPKPMPAPPPVSPRGLV